MKKNMLFLMVSCCCLGFLFSGCSLFNKLGSNAGAGFATTTDTIGHNLISGIRDELTSPASTAKIKTFLDSLVSAVAATLAVEGGKAEDKLLNPRVIKWADSLVNAVSGEHLQSNIKLLQASLIGKTKTDLQDIRRSFEQLLNEILSDNTRGRIGLLRDELLGPKTTAALSKIIDTAVTHIIDSSLNTISARLHTDFNPLIKDDLSFIQKYATRLLIALGAIAAAIIILVWRNRQKYLRMLTIVTKQVNAIPDQNVYDKVTAKIKDDTVAAGLEPDLRDVLKKNGLIDTSQWQKQK